MSKKYILPLYVAVASILIVCLAISIAFKPVEQPDDSVTDAYKEKSSQSCILVMGKDKASGLSDVIMLVSFDKDQKSAAVMQIPRDTYAKYTSVSPRKINAAPKILGEEGFCAFLSENLGVKIDGYVSFELEAFGRIIDIIGGVEMTLSRNFDYEDPEQNLYIHLKKGRQSLNGEQAQMLVRFRKGYIRGDLDRLDVQKQFIAAFIAKVKSSVNIMNIYSLASEILPLLNTNIGAMTLFSLGVNALSVNEENVALFTLPGEDARAGENGASYYVMSAKSTQDALVRYFGKVSEDIDKNRVFCNFEYEKFKKIYEKAYELDISFAKELE